MLYLTSVSRANLSEAVAEQLIAPLLNGTLKPGDRLPSERELMESLNVGRSSVREAIQRLTMLGLIEVRPGIGTFVTERRSTPLLQSSLRGLLMVDEVTADLLEARRIIEPEIAALAAQRATEEDLQRIQTVLEETRSLIERGEHSFDRSAHFHKALAEATHNQVLVRFMESIMGYLVERGQTIDAVPGYPAEELRTHQQVLNLVRAGKMGEAREALRLHIESSVAMYIDTVERE